MSRPRSTSKDSVTFVVKRSVKRYLQEGKKHFDSGNIARAIEAYNNALLVDPACALTHFNLGFAYHEEHCYAEAKAAYRRAIDLQPDCSLFREHLGRLYFEQDDYEAAIRLLEQAIEIGDVQPISFGLLGRAQYETGAFDSAACSLERMLLEEDHPPLVGVARYHLALAYLKQERLARARRTAAGLLAMEDVDPQLLSDLGERFVRVKCVTIARQLFERVIMQSEERLTARKRYEEILAIDHKVNDILPQLVPADEEQTLRLLHVLLNVGSDAAAAALAPLVDSRSALVREVVVEYHRRFGYPLAEGIERLLADEVGFVRERTAAYAIALELEDEAEQLLPRLEDESSPVRQQAARFFGAMGTIAHLQPLQDALAAEQQEETRELLRVAQEAIKQRYQERVQALARRRPKDLPETAINWNRWLLAGAASLSLGYILYWLISHRP